MHNTQATNSVTQIHPVLDARNRPILAPSSFDINTSIQRCLVKATALHGLGLYIYAGEDLPVQDGGVAHDTVGPIVQAGAELLVAGNAVFGAGQPERDARALLAAARLAAGE